MCYDTKQKAKHQKNSNNVKAHSHTLTKPKTKVYVACFNKEKNNAKLKSLAITSTHK